MYALVDCNNFFVSCERAFRPDLEGKAVVVLSNNDGCVVSRSNEAKAMGIKMGTPFFQLEKYVHSGVLVPFSSNYTLYGDLSARVMSILAEESDRLEIYSIDEAFFTLDGLTLEELESHCRALVARIRQWVGIPVSIGIAPTKTLAKLASHFAKKYKGYKGVCLMETEEKRRKALGMVPVTEVWGVGRRLGPRLQSKGIKTALDLADKSRDWIAEELHKPGLCTWLELNGEVAVEEEEHEARKSICTSRSFATMLSRYEELRERVSDFAASCARKLRSEGTAARKVTTFIWTNRFREDLQQYYPSATICLPRAENSNQEVVGAALQALKSIYRPDVLYKKAGVIVHDILPQEEASQVLFDEGDPVLREKEAVLSALMDRAHGDPRLGDLRLAVQRKGHYAEGIRREHCSPLYTTSLDEIIKVY